MVEPEVRWVVLARVCRMFDPKPVGGTGLPTNRTSAIGYARYTSSAIEVKTKVAEPTIPLTKRCAGRFTLIPIHTLTGTIPKKKRPE